MTISKLIIWDCDGVLCDSSARFKPRADGKGVDVVAWRKSEPISFFDPLLPAAKEYQYNLKHEPTIYQVIATARHVCWSSRAWIEHKLGWPNHLIYRRDPNDSIGGAELKIAGLKKLLRLKQFHGKPIEIVEDNPRYLGALVNYLHNSGHNVIGRLIPSNQGF